MDKEKTTWERVSHLSLPNQVQALCMCIDEIKNDLETKVEAEPESETKTPKK